MIYLTNNGTKIIVTITVGCPDRLRVDRSRRQKDLSKKEIVGVLASFSTSYIVTLYASNPDSAPEVGAVVAAETIFYSV